MTIEIDISRQDYLDFNKHYFIKKRLTNAIITGLLLIVALQWFMNREGFQLVPTLISTLVSAGLYVFLITRQLQNTKKIPKEDGSILGKKQIRITDKEIICMAEGSETLVKWSSIKSVEEGKKAWYLYVDTNMALIIPRRFLESGAQAEAFSAIVKRRLPAGGS